MYKFTGGGGGGGGVSVQVCELVGECTSGD